jgi:hypothetical protein
MRDERSDSWTSTRNFHICYARVRTMRGSRPNGWSRIGNFHISCTRVRTKTDRHPDKDIWIAILVLRRRASGRDTTLSGRLDDLSFTGTWKVSETGRVPRGVRTCCWNVRTDASWIEPSRHSGGTGRKCTSSGRMILGLTAIRTIWHVVRTGWLDRPDGWQGTEIFAVQSLLRELWIVKSLFTASFHIQVILSKTQNEPKILTKG